MERLFHFTNEGARLAASLHRPESRPEAGAPGVVLLHGMTGNRIEAHYLFVKTSRALAERGVASLRFDFRGCGESEGDFQDLSVRTEWSDAGAALTVLRETDGVDPDRVGVLGLSFGGLVAALLTGGQPAVRSAVLWSAVAFLRERLETRHGERARRIALGQDWVEEKGFRFGSRFLADAQDVEPVAAIASSRADVLVVHGSDDETVERADAHAYHDALRARAGPRSEMVIIDGGDHTFLGSAPERAAIHQTVQWFLETL